MSDNVEDRRGRGGGGQRLALGGGAGAIIMVLIALFFGLDPTQLMQSLPPSDGGGGPAAAVPSSPAEEETRRFVGAVLASTEDVWNELLPRAGRRYAEPNLVLFSGEVSSACGFATAAVGPFYCPADQRVYLDMSFFAELERRLGAPGDFAQAYVIAHEVGHHIQTLLGTSAKVHAAKSRASEAEANALSVRLELQADYYAGVWAHHAQRAGLIEPGDFEEAIRAAGAIGDDRLQKQAQGYVVPDSFTHGTSEQRVRWFRRGLESGDPTGGDTFSASNP